MKTNSFAFRNPMRKVHLQRGLAFGIIIIGALIAFEMFNYSTTEYALSDLLGDLAFFGISWATILALAFCGIDFAGIARLFTPQEGGNEVHEVWYLFGAWLLAATMNAMLTWWGVSLAILNHQTLGNEVIARPMLLRVVPIFVAVMVWLIRVLIIGTFSVAGDRLFSLGDMRAYRVNRSSGVAPVRSASITHAQSTGAISPSTFRPAPKSNGQEPVAARPEPTYHPLTMSSARQTGVSGNEFPTKNPSQARF